MSHDELKYGELTLIIEKAKKMLNLTYNGLNTINKKWFNHMIRIQIIFISKFDN